jgi:SHS2 domain-containing protein
MSLAAPEANRLSPIPFRIIEHPSDTGFEVHGSSPAELFAHAALALCQLLRNTTRNQEGERMEEEIRVEASDFGELMVNFLQEFLYLHEARGLVCTEVQIEEISEKGLTARAVGHRFEPDKDEELLGVKAVTYHQLFVGEENDRWRARVLLDI